MRVILIIWVVSLSVQVFAQNSKVTIDTNKNLEFLGYIIEQGDPMGNDKNHPVSIIIDMYPENKNSEALFKLFDLASNIDYSTLTNLMYFLPEFPLDKEYSIPKELASNLGFKSEYDKKEGYMYLFSDQQFVTIVDYGGDAKNPFVTNLGLQKIDVLD